VHEKKKVGKKCAVEKVAVGPGMGALLGGGIGALGGGAAGYLMGDEKTKKRNALLGALGGGVLGGGAGYGASALMTPKMTSEITPEGGRPMTQKEQAIQAELLRQLHEELAADKVRHGYYDTTQDDAQKAMRLSGH
jgi:phage-related minor tail protein